jgi:hypothetical protein
MPTFFVPLKPNRDREGPRGLPPPTPPDIRGTSPAVRWMASGCTTTPTGASCPGVPALSSSQMPEIIRPLAGGHRSAPLQVATLLHRAGLQHAPARLLGPLLTSARRSGSMAPPAVLSPDTPPLSRGQLAYHPCLDAGVIPHRPMVDGGLCCGVPARPSCTTPHRRFVSLAPHIRSTLPADPTSR